MHFKLWIENLYHPKHNPYGARFNYTTKNFKDLLIMADYIEEHGDKPYNIGYMLLQISKVLAGFAKRHQRATNSFYEVEDLDYLAEDHLTTDMSHWASEMKTVGTKIIKDNENLNPSNRKEMKEMIGWLDYFYGRMHRLKNECNNIIKHLSDTRPRDIRLKNNTLMIIEFSDLVKNLIDKMEEKSKTWR